MKISILDLPNELIFAVADAIAEIHDLAALVRTSRRLYQVLNDYLYRSDVVDVENGRGIALVWAARFGLLRTAELSLAQGPDLEARPPFTVPYELEISGLFKSLSIRHRGRMTPLQIAVCFGSEAVANLLIESGAEFAKPFPRSMERCSTLHIASAMGLTSVVRLLVREGADLNSEDKRRRTPLHYALRRIDDESQWLRQGVTVAWLLELGGNPEARDVNGIKPRMLAESSPNAMVERVLTKGFRSFVLNIPITETFEAGYRKQDHHGKAAMAVVDYGISKLQFHATGMA